MLEGFVTGIINAAHSTETYDYLVDFEFIDPSIDSVQSFPVLGKKCKISQALNMLSSEVKASITLDKKNLLTLEFELLKEDFSITDFFHSYTKIQKGNPILNLTYFAKNCVTKEIRYSVKFKNCSLYERSFVHTKTCFIDGVKNGYYDTLELRFSWESLEPTTEEDYIKCSEFDYKKL